jgi:hypothetical protein
VHLLLCDAWDAPALWAARAFAASGRPVQVVTSAMLMRAGFEHRVGADGASTVIELPTGRRIDTVEVKGTLNRLTGPRLELLPAVRRGDCEYAAQELWAFWLSWLKTLPAPVLNPPSPAGLSGARMDRSDWEARADRLGLPISDRGRAQHLLIVCGGSVVGPRAPSAAVAGARALSEAAGCPLLGVCFDDAWAFAHATTHPDLRRGGGALAGALARALELEPA